jgi:hypothetical protein
MRASERLRAGGLALGASQLPSLVALDRAVTRVTAQWPDVVTAPEMANRGALARDMLRRVMEWDWAAVPTQRVTAAAFAAFDEDRRDIVMLKPLRDFYLREIGRSEQEAFLVAMFRVYLDSFTPGASHTINLAAGLRSRRAELGARIVAILQKLPDLLQPDRAPGEVAAVMSKADDPYAAMKAAGFPAPHVPGLPQYAHLAFVKQIAPQLDQASAQEQLLRWLNPDQAQALQAGASDAVAALLAPWRERTPAEAMQSRLTEAIVAAYGDPRIFRGGIWAGFAVPLKAVLLRWLTKADMRLFCDVITATQYDAQWPPRRDFWLRLFEQHRIDEAWVAFGSGAGRFAQRLVADTANVHRRFASQTDRQGGTSLLIMRIGNKIVVDGCHSYQTHIFSASSPLAPKLYQSTYQCDLILRQSSLSKRHNSIPLWQRWVEQNI